MSQATESKLRSSSGVKRNLNVRNMVQIGMLGAVATVLMIFEIPLWFAPSFYEIDLSEVAVLIGTFSMGPVAGVLIEFIKIMLNFVINGTITAGIGELANFLMGCALIVPAGILYKRNKTRKGALIAMGAGTVSMTVIACLLNAFMLLPAYAAVLMPMDQLLAMGNAVNPSITGMTTFILFAVAPFNLIKCIIVSAFTLLLYKKISVILKG